MSVKDKSASYAQLERKVNTGYRTIKQNCIELEGFEQIKITKITHPSNGKPSFIVKITNEGRTFLKKEKKKNEN
jgi:phage antirepressor YoqD-like protein